MLTVFHFILYSLSCSFSLLSSLPSLSAVYCFIIFLNVHVFLSSCQNKAWYAKFNRSSRKHIALSNTWQNKLLTLWKYLLHPKQLIECKSSSMSLVWTNVFYFFFFFFHCCVEHNNEQWKNSNNILDEMYA